MKSIQIEIPTASDIPYKEWKRGLLQQAANNYIKRTIGRRTKRLREILADEHLTWKHHSLVGEKKVSREEVLEYAEKDAFEKVLEYGCRIIMKKPGGDWYETDLADGFRNKLKSKEQEGGPQ